MNLKCFYNYLDGKNLCNIFANLIVEELQKESPDIKTEISVINVGNFFVVKGRTTSTKVLNVTDIFANYLKTSTKKSVENLRVIDTLLYNSPFSFNFLNLSETFEKNSLYDSFDVFVKYHSTNDLFFNCQLDEQNSTILFDCDAKDVEKVNNLIKEKFPNYSIMKVDLSNEVYVSDRFYGLSMNFEKLYHVLLFYIKNHLFQKGMSSKLVVGIKSNSYYTEIDNLNVSLNLSGSKIIVNQEWLESLILDVFPFRMDEIYESLNLSECNLMNELTPSSKRSCWENLDLISDLVLY
jgi:hypothetical protein